MCRGRGAGRRRVSGDGRGAVAVISKTADIASHDDVARNRDITARAQNAGRAAAAN